MNQQIKFQFKKVAVNGLFLTALIFILAAPSLFTLKMISREYHSVTLFGGSQKQM